MRTVTTRSLLLALVLSSDSLYGQSVKIAEVSSSYPITVPASFTGATFSTTFIGVSYPVGLAANQYVSGTQLNTDFQTYLGSYPSPSDPLEAILGSVLQSILNKYPQMAGGSLSGELTGPCVPQMFAGVTIPCTPNSPGANLGSVSVVIGTYNSSGGIITGFSRNAARNTSKPAPVKPTTAK
jgi:hypothetical protein